ncbi:PREDICTED: uncharacterized protein LOC105461040 [Wasmannia auropunctata]|uniref:uncharacterized protein LOC105461040 n=1 Tax=Wasmannia auropunctata TaxID=64793 RepID=UPI0005EE8FCB|nr:PREDICTED: uncharacterized protein LOC105461040 [Wasmannia auropunctata]
MRKKGWFFHATDFQTLMYPCFMFCRILGIFPYKINNMIFEASKPRYILSTATICVSCVSHLIVCYQLQIFTKINFENTIKLLSLTCDFILLSTLGIATLIFSKPRMRLLQIIMEISSKLSPESYQKLSGLIHAKDIFGSFYIIGMLFMYSYKERLDVLPTMSIIYINLFIFHTDMLYMNCVCVLKTCVKEIDNNLLHTLIVNNKPRVLTMIYEKRNPFLIIKLKNLMKKHMAISNAVQMLNMSLSVQLLVSIIIIFYDVSLNTYLYLVQWHSELVFNLDKQVGDIYLLYILYYIIKTALIVWACETCKNQAQEIRTTIHHVLNSTRDEKIKYELQLFS